MSKCNTNIHSFIHYGDLCSAPSRLLLRSAPDPCTAKNKSFETRVECVRKKERAYVTVGQIHRPKGSMYLPNSSSLSSSADKSGMSSSESAPKKTGDAITREHEKLSKLDQQTRKLLKLESSKPRT